MIDVCFFFNRKKKIWDFSRPWMVGLFSNSRQPWHCAGVLVNENTVLTAAHCLTDGSVSEMKAIIGVHTILGKLNPLNYYSIKSIHRHPDYKTCCKNDLAILKLTESVLYGPKINAVCLPFQEQLSMSDETKLINRTGVIIGWGDSSDDGLTNFINSFSLKQGEKWEEKNNHKCSTLETIWFSNNFSRYSNIW